LHSIITIIEVTIIERTSAIGAAYKIPSIPKYIGKIITPGIKNIVSRESDNRIACTGFPID